VALRDLFRKSPSIAVHVIIRGRIGEGWYDVDETLNLAIGTTLGEAIAAGEKRGIPFAEALENSPHLRDTLMLNGERCPVNERAGEVLSDGDEIYLLASIAGG